MGIEVSREMVSEHVQETAHQALDTFGPIYLKSYAMLYSEHCMKAAGITCPLTAPAAPLHLKEAPLQASVLASGWMCKQSPGGGPLRRRFFVLSGKRDHYVGGEVQHPIQAASLAHTLALALPLQALRYYEKEEQCISPTKCKGVISPGFYSVRRVKDEDDVRAFGEFCLRLVPLDGLGRVWLLQCESRAQLAKWKAVLSYAATHAEPPLSGGPVEKAAFVDALHRSRRELGLWGAHRVAFDEARELRCLARQYAIAESNLDTGVAGVDSTITPAQVAEAERQLHNVTTASWAYIQNLLKQHQSGMEAVARAVPRAIEAQQRCSLNALWREAFTDVEGIVIELAKFSTRPLLAAFMEPILNAHKTAVRLWWDTTADVLRRQAHASRQLEVFARDAQWKRGVLLPAFSHLRALTRGEAGSGHAKDALAFLGELGWKLGDLLTAMQGVSFVEVEHIVEGSLTNLLQRAVAAFLAGSRRSEARSADVLREVLADYVQDAATAVQQDMRHIMHLVMLPCIRRQAVLTAFVGSVLESSAARGAYPEILNERVVARMQARAGTAGPARSRALSRRSSSGPIRRPAAGVVAPAAPPTTPSRGGRPATAGPLVAPTSLAATVPVKLSLPEHVLTVFVDTDWLLDAVLRQCLDQALRQVYTETKRAADELLALTTSLPGSAAGVTSDSGAGGTASTSGP